MSRGRRIVDYLRISVTDRCNLRCVYCMPPEGVECIPHESVLTYEEIAFFVRVAADLGFSKVRLTGGEPLVRRGLSWLVRQLAVTPGIVDISLTTNGILLPRYAEELKAAGLNRVNISVDTFDPERYRQVTRGGSLEQALQGVEAAFAARLTPVKINTVLTYETLDELPAFVAQTRERPLHVRFIEWMPVGGCGPTSPVDSPTRDEVIARLSTMGRLQPAPSPGGWGPARYFTFAGYRGTLGFISAMSDHFCGDCNRLRLTADGKLKNCLFSDDEVEVREPLREENAQTTAKRIRESLERKTFNRFCVDHANQRGMSQIGG
ncbi:MAG: GTP 3',8-cyclase MoaA [Actinobacteria bacterium]|nr:GTP 3',8-cyclase MoaA [Actinomycetota bacterium]